LIVRSSWLLIALLCVPVSLFCGSSRDFPGPQRELKSPDGRYSVENIDSGSEPHHTLLLKKTETGTVRTLCNYNRSVSVLWSPDGKKLVVNDYLGSNLSESVIFFVDQTSSPLDIGAELLQSLKSSPDRRSLVGNDHVYFAVSRWEGDEAVKLKVWGYGEVDPKGFSRLYIYQVGGTFRLMSTHKSR
jgi:hypothetical protein